MADQPTSVDINAVIEELNRDPVSKAYLERAQYAVLTRTLLEQLTARDAEIAQLRAQPSV